MKPIKPLLLSVLLVLTSLLLPACGRGNQGPERTLLSVSILVQVGKTKELSEHLYKINAMDALLAAADGEEAEPLSFVMEDITGLESTDEKICTVDESGTVTGVTVGDAQILFEAKGALYACDVEVIKDQTPGA